MAKVAKAVIGIALIGLSFAFPAAAIPLRKIGFTSFRIRNQSGTWTAT